MVADKEGWNHCQVLDVLSEEEADLVRRLFLNLDRDPPKHPLMAKLDPSKPPAKYGCPFRFEWGFDHYCNNPERIKHFLEFRK